MLNLSPKELKVIAKMRGIKGHKSISEDEKLSVLNLSKINFSKAIIEKIRKELNESRHKFSKSKINEIRRNLYEIGTEENLFASKIKEIRRSLFESEENLFKPKQYYDYDNIEYKETRNVKDLFDFSISEDYYKPIITKDPFNGNYTQYESKGDKEKNLSMKKYLDMIKPYLSDIINDHKTQGKWRIHSGNTITERKTQSEWKIQLTMAINFISSKDSDETCTMHAKSNNVEIIMGNETNEIIEELFKYFLQRYQERLEESMRRSEFSFDAVDALYYNVNKTSLSRGGSYIDSSKWLKNKKATINPKNNDDKCFQYALTVALNYEQIKIHSERISKIEPFIDQCNWKEIDFPSHSKNWKKFESNNRLIVLNILYVPHNTEKIRHACKSKHKLERENQVILLMIADIILL